MEIVLFNLFKGLLEFRTQKSTRFNSFKKIFNNKKLWNYEDNKPTLVTEEINNNTKKVVIRSHNTHLYLDKPDSKENEEKGIAYTEKFCETIDIIHFSINLNYPLILEGMKVKGRKQP